MVRTGAPNLQQYQVNIFKIDSGNPLFDTDCRMVLNSYDPNEKLAFPQGIDVEHFMEANTPIEYQINFQNTGTAPALQVVLRDTFSAKLNPASIRLGAASHPYTWNLSGPGILSVYFADINLPDSNSNEAASHRFVKFIIEQQVDNPLGTLIENRAGIFFDFNPAVLTNTVYHTIGHDFLEVVAADNPGAVSIRVSVLPNPVAEAAWLIFEPANEGKQMFSLFDANGKVVRVQEFSGEKMLFERGGLPPGVYFFLVGNQTGSQVAGGKMLLR